MEPLRGDEPIAAGSALASRAREVEFGSSMAVLEAFEPPRTAWADAEQSIVAGGAAATITAAGPDRFEAVRTAAQSLFAERGDEQPPARAARPRLFGGFAFHEGSNAADDDTWAGFPDAKFVLPAVALVDAGERTWLVANAVGPAAATTAEDRLATWHATLEESESIRASGQQQDCPGIVSRRFMPGEDGWHEQVTAAVDRIKRGSLRKVVLAQAQTVDLARPLVVSDALARLSETYPSCYRFLFGPESGGAFFGATPERLVSRDGRRVQTEALAGSTGRGDTSEEDEWLARELQESEKDSHEQELVAEAIKAQLAPFATAISTGDRTVKRLASVQHLQTPITADLAEDDHVLALVEALHPTPAVGGLPPDLARETIHETEAFDRGWYASPVGWFDAEGNGSFAVAIRSAVACGDRATLFAGNGIVADSDPAREWDEVQLKYRPILDTLE